MRVTVMEGSRKSRMCLQHSGNLEAPRIYIRARDRDFRQNRLLLCIARYDRE